MTDEERDQVLIYSAERLANIEALLRVIGRLVDVVVIGRLGLPDRRVTFLDEVEKAKTENIPPLAPHLNPSRHHD